MMNRKQRREYEKEIKNDHRASKCPHCGHLTLWHSASLFSTLDQEHPETVIQCEVCNYVAASGETVQKLIPPGIILPWPFDVIENALKYAEEHPDELK